MSCAGPLAGVYKTAVRRWRWNREVAMDGAVAETIVIAGPDWPLEIYNTLKQFDVSQVCYVPDAGHARLIMLSHNDAAIRTTVLTTEEEGVALCAGAWIGGDRAVLLMQSSGVGNCVNMLSLMNSCRLPLLTLVTMRGEWAEFNPWQIPMGRGTPGAFELMGATVLRIERPDEAAEVVSAAATLAFDGDRQVAVLISQRMLGRKKWLEQK
jgi:sulfopyruvate decarboxylase alpha subunit